MSRRENSEWLAKTVAEHPGSVFAKQVDAVGFERVLDSLSVGDAWQAFGGIDLRRWAQRAPEVAERIKELRRLSGELHTILLVDAHNRIKDLL